MAEVSPDSGGSGGGGRTVIPLWKQRNFLIGAGVILLVLIGAGAAIALTGGDSSDEPEPEATTVPTTTGETTTVPTTEPGEEPPIAPLTGLPEEELVAAERPALLAKIDNVPLIERPDQAGLEIADVVYEEPVEGATRLLAVWHSRVPERVGPIRSTRFIDAGIAWPFGEVPYVYSGGTPEKVAAINESPVQTFDESGLAAVGANVRDPSWDAPHNLFATTENVWAAANDRTAPEPLFTFLGEDESFVGEPVEKVEFPNLSDATYTWDEASGTWKREYLRRRGSGVEPHLAESGEQVAPTNLVFQSISGTDRDSVVGEGDAWFFSQGQMIRGRWARETLDDRTTFQLADGAEVSFTPGTTWIHLNVGGEPLLLPAESA